MKFFLAFLMLSLNSALACEVSLPHQIIVFSDDHSGKNFYQTENCHPKALEDLHLFITATEGRIASYQLKEMMASKNHEISVQPSSVVIHQFKNLVREQLPLPPGVQIKSVSNLTYPGIMPLSAGDTIEINCSTCLFGTQQPLNVTISGFDGTKQSLIATADFKKMVKAYRLLSPLPSFSSLSDKSMLKEEYIEVIPHTDLITDLDRLKFYKTNKPLKAGDLLRLSDLNAVNLVKAGLKTEVVLENQMVRIKTSGISRSNGSIGELVEVYHPQKNKKYQGKVIDINKVLVEL